MSLRVLLKRMFQVAIEDKLVERMKGEYQAFDEILYANFRDKLEAEIKAFGEQEMRDSVEALSEATGAPFQICN